VAEPALEARGERAGQAADPGHRRIDVGAERPKDGEGRGGRGEPEAQPGPGEDHEHQAERRVGRRLHRLSLHREAHGLAERQGGEVGVLLGPEEVEPRTGGSS
jgi:hypothetical protein